MTESNDVRRMNGSVVAVTGATSGIGLATARSLSAEGARLVVVARRSESLARLVDEFGSDETAAVVGDVRDPETSRRMVDVANERFGRLDVLVANAGIGAYGGVLDYTDDKVREIVETNYLATTWAVRAVVPTMRAQGGGDIVIVSSVAGVRGGANEAVYAGSKAAQIGFAGAIDRELRADSIRVAAVCPAAVNTNFAMGAGRSPGDPWLNNVLTPDDVAQAIVYALRQPRRMRTQLWSMWSMAEGS